jgi:ADP-ribose pyrophosphatase YjhB (NUDIX family)
MYFWHTISRKLAYHIAYPVLRLYYRRCTPARDTARAIVLHKNHVLLVRNIGVKYWSFPGGAFYNSETPEEGVLRELQEELQVASPIILYKQGVYDGVHREESVQVHIFVIETASYFHKKEWEIDEAAWFPLAALPSNLSVATKARLEEFVAQKQNIRGTW